MNNALIQLYWREYMYLYMQTGSNIRKFVLMHMYISHLRYISWSVLRGGRGGELFYVVYSFFYALKTLVKMGNYLLLKTLDWKVWNLGLDKIIPVFPLTFLKTRVDRHFFFKCFKKFYLGIQNKNTCIRGESRHFNKGRAPGFVRK